MTNFEKWLKEKGYSNPAHNDAYELGRFDGAREGWRAALEWVKREAISLDERGDSSRNVINRELEKKS